MLSTPADFPFFNDCTAASTSLRRMGWSSSVSVWGQSSTDGSPLALWLYSWVQFSVHRFSISRSSVMHFPERSWTVVAFLSSQGSSLSRVVMPSYCCSSSDFLQSHYTVWACSNPQRTARKVSFLKSRCAHTHGLRHVRFPLWSLGVLSPRKVSSLKSRCAHTHDVRHERFPLWSLGVLTPTTHST